MGLNIPPGATISRLNYWQACRDHREAFQDYWKRAARDPFGCRCNHPANNSKRLNDRIAVAQSKFSQFAHIYEPKVSSNLNRRQ